MQPDALALLWDARRASARILEIVDDRSWDDYQRDVLLRSAERQFQIVGEALNGCGKLVLSPATTTPARSER